MFDDSGSPVIESTRHADRFDADQFARCAGCWRWFDRGDPAALAGHRGPLPHAVAPRCTAWADKDE